MGKAMQKHSRPVLVVDDNKTLAELFGAMLTSSGYDVIIATDGAEAIARVRSDFPCLVLCDEKMPGMSGVEVLSSLRKDPATADLPFVLMRTLATGSPITPAPNACLQKPFIPAEMLCRVAELTTPSTVVICGDPLIGDDEAIFNVFEVEQAHENSGQGTHEITHSVESLCVL
jgi:CheY-like chemotaxis protein